ncbi:MAG: hypothetical protein WCC06_10090 [Candidatus Aminicenantales bacterium]
MPRLTKDYFLNFYGGEPLLSFDLIQKTVHLLNTKSKAFRKKPHYSLTTNGSLLSREILQFLNAQRFSVVLSFDGLAQEVHRKKGSLAKTVARIDEISNYPNIRLKINSVFTPETTSCLSASLQWLIHLNCSHIHFSLSTLKPWDEDSIRRLKKELKKLRKILLSYYEKKRIMPVVNFREEPLKGFFTCAAGIDRLAITPKGNIWGCLLFPDYFQGKEKTSEYKKYYFGRLHSFIKKYPQVYPPVQANCERLSLVNFSTSQTDCSLCPDMEDCRVCPVSASFSGSPLGKIPDFVCQLQQVLIKEKKWIRQHLFPSGK